MEHALSRRQMLTLTAAAAVGTTSPCAIGATKDSVKSPFILGINTSTIRNHKLPIVQTAKLAAKVGFQGIEPWISELDEHKKSGQSFEALGGLFRDLNLPVESTIGFFEWIVDDKTRRTKALDEAKRNFEMVRAIGGKRLAAPPVGATNKDQRVDPARAAERYRALLELGDQFGVVAQAEVWGFSQTLGNLGEAMQVAIAADHPKACVLGDVYHFYKGGTGVEGLRLLSANAMHVVHLNDYPADPPRAKINDADRVYPGDGVAPLSTIFRTLHSIGFRGMLSVELFNKSYYVDDAETILRKAFTKMKAQVDRAFA